MDAQQIADRLKVAAEALELAGVPDDLRAPAFKSALNAVGLPDAKGAGIPAPPTAHILGAPAQAGSRLEAISQRLGVEMGAVAALFEEDDDQGIRLILRRSMLPEPDQKAASMRQVALLLTVCRQAAEVEEYTPFSLIRGECAELKVLDASNFATEVGKLELRRRGPRNKQEAKASRHHYEDAAELIRAITEAGR